VTSVFVAPRRPGGTRTSPAPAPAPAPAPKSAVEVDERSWPQGLTPPPELRPPTLSPLFTTDQAADYLQISVRSVKNLLGDGRIPFIKIGRATRIHRDDLDGFIARNRRRQRQGLRPS